MLLKSIEFTDFRCFLGKTVIDLSCDSERNVVVILGDNTNGKSTIVQAFAWCFYGLSNFDNPEIYNRQIARDLPIRGKTRVEVKVKFEHDAFNLENKDLIVDKKTTYIATRYQDFYKGEDGRMRESSSVFKLEYINPDNKETLPCGKLSSEYQKAINAIIDEKLAPYFFFAGEKNHEIDTKSLSLAVKNLLGIEALANMRLHLIGDVKNGAISANSVLGSYRKLQQDNTNVEAQKELEKMEQAERALENIEDELEKIDSDIKTYSAKIDEIQAILRDAAPTKAIQQKRDQIASSINRERELLEKAYNRYLEEFNNNAVNLFTYPLLAKAREKLTSMDLSDKGIKGIESIAIEELLSRGVCLCGTDLKEGTSAYKEVAKYLDILPPKSVGLLVRQLQDNMFERENLCREYVTKSNDLYGDIQLSIQRIHDLEREEQAAIEELKKVPLINTDQYAIDERHYKQRIASMRLDKERLIRNQTAERSKYDTARNNFNMLSAKSNKVHRYAVCYEYAQRVFEWLSDTYDEKERQVRSDLESNVTTLFNKIYSGNRQVKIDANYNITIVPPADTGGVKAIQYFSYVGGLVQLACKAMAERQNGDLSGGEFPLVLDAAFSHTDKKHTKSIAIELSKVTSQLIFAVMDKDWAHVAEDISFNIYKSYRLVKVSEDQACIEEA